MKSGSKDKKPNILFDSIIDSIEKECRYFRIGI